MDIWRQVDVELTPAEVKFYAGMQSANKLLELGLIGAGSIGGGWLHTYK